MRLKTWEIAQEVIPNTLSSNDYVMFYPHTMDDIVMRCYRRTNEREESWLADMREPDPHNHLQYNFQRIFHTMANDLLAQMDWELIGFVRFSRWLAPIWGRKIEEPKRSLWQRVKQYFREGNWCGDELRLRSQELAAYPHYHNRPAILNSAISEIGAKIKASGGVTRQEKLLFERSRIDMLAMAGGRRKSS